MAGSEADMHDFTDSLSALAGVMKNLRRLHPKVADVRQNPDFYGKVNEQLDKISGAIVELKRLLGVR